MEEKLSPKKQKLLKILLTAATVNAVAIIILVIIKIWIMLDENSNESICGSIELGGAGEWFLLGITLFLLYIVIVRKSEKSKKENDENLQ